MDAYDAELAYRETIAQMNRDCEGCELHSQLKDAEELLQLADAVMFGQRKGSEFYEGYENYHKKWGDGDG